MSGLTAFFLLLSAYRKCNEGYFTHRKAQVNRLLPSLAGYQRRTHHSHTHQKQNFMFDKFKTFVGRSGAQQGANMLQNAMTQKGAGGIVASPGGAVGSSGMPASLQQFMSQAVQLGGKLFEEKEWQCPCGFKFKAGGEWVACAPIHCEVPRCPNPKYYVDGPGRALLEANPNGVRLQEVDSSKTLGTGQQSSGNGAPKNSMGRLGGRK